jgi:hypothetical protein
MEATPDPQAVKDADLLADSIINANQMLKQWQAYKDAMTARLTSLHSKGLIPTKFEAHGHAFSLREGKQSVSFDAIAKEKINFLKDDLTLQGHSHATRGTPFWDTRVLKEGKSSKSEAPITTQQAA